VVRFGCGRRSGRMVDRLREEAVGRVKNAIGIRIKGDDNRLEEKGEVYIFFLSI